jgi:F0F1-type ATP synthase membrane subunit b/b'
MLAFIYSIILIFAEAGGNSSGGWWQKAEPYLNYPGFEAWKFLNLGIFIAIMVYLVKKPLTEAFKAKREAIRADLIKAEEEKQAALVQLTSTEAKLARLESESEEVVERAKAESKAEKMRITKETEAEVKRLQAQSAGEIERKTQQVKAELRRFSAEESIRLAEEKLKAQLNAEKDAGLVKAGIKAMGGLN